MKTAYVLAAVAISLIGTQAAAPFEARAQPVDTVRWQVMGVRRCPRADSLFGRYWRSHASSIRAWYSRRRDETTLRTPDRKVSWQKVGPSRLVGTEAFIRVSGRNQTTDSGRIELAMHFVDSIYRSSAQATLDLQIGDTTHLEIRDPQVDYVTGPNVNGIPVIVTYLLTPAQSLAPAGLPREVKGTMGPYPFILYDWELWDINSIYRGSFCGVE